MEAICANKTSILGSLHPPTLLTLGLITVILMREWLGSHPIRGPWPQKVSEPQL